MHKKKKGGPHAQSGIIMSENITGRPVATSRPWPTQSRSQESQEKVLFTYLLSQA